MSKKIDVGSHLQKFDGFERVDINSNVNPDVIADALKLPYKDNEVDYYRSSHCIEHTDNPLEMMRECWRVLKPKGIAEITFPFAGSPMDRNYNHKWTCMKARFFHWFYKENYDHVYCPDITFRLIRIRYQTHSWWPFMWALCWVLNLNNVYIREFYECGLLSIWFPMDEITGYLDVVK